MWKVGERVLAQRPPEIYRYPGTIRHVDGQRFYIIFDDGDDGFATAAELSPCQFEEGNGIEVYQAASGGYLPARVAATADENVRVRYLNREEQSVPWNKIRINPETWKQPDWEREGASRQWSVCDRVLACLFDLDWYPGIILEPRPDRLRILFDNGTQAVIPAQKVRPFHLSPGERVMCRRKGGRDFYTGQIAALDGEKVQVLYDDGKTETTSVRLLRLRRDEWLPVNPALMVHAGSRVLGQWFDLFWYPGTVLTMNGKRLHIAYDHGSQGLATPDQVKPFNLPIGTRVLCRRRGGPQYLPGTVKELEGNRLRVVFEDGVEEWLPVGLVRLEK
jgi:hypothetical protein